ncbi:MAG: sugar nucleotide-binding protein [Pirellulales bacterium]
MSPIASPTTPLPLLLTGISGVAGYNAFFYFREKYPGRVIGLRQRNNWRLCGDGIAECDAEDRDRLTRLFDEHRFAAVLDCAGNCALKSCELDADMAWRINVDGVRNLLDVIDGRARFVHLSVDLVFSGSPQRADGWAGYSEGDSIDPVTVYGQTMVAAEQLILERDPAACILRVSLPMGISFNGHAGAIDWIQSRFKHHRPATLYYDEVRSPTYTDCLNELCESMLGNRLSGVFHAGGPRRATLYEIAQTINRVGGYDPKLLHGCPRIDAGPIPPRAGNVTLDSRKLTSALGYDPFDPWPLDSRFAPTDRNWHFDRPTGEGGSPELLAAALYRNPRREGVRPPQSAHHGRPHVRS